MIRVGQPVEFTFTFRDVRIVDGREVDTGPLPLDAGSLVVVFKRPDGTWFSREAELEPVGEPESGVAIYRAPAGEINQPRSWRVHGIADGVPSEEVFLWVLPALT